MWRITLKSFFPYFKNRFLNLSGHILDLFFPRICLHCGSCAEDAYLIFCKTCFHSLEFTQIQDRCRPCGKSKEESHCPHCKKDPSPFLQVLSAFDLHSPAALSLQRKYHNPAHYFLAKGAGALMAFYYAQNGLKWPQVIVPSATRRFGFCPILELAKTISFLFQIPLASCDIEEKRVLLVGDLLNPSFFEAGTALAEQNPHSIYGLTFFSFEL